MKKESKESKSTDDKFGFASFILGLLAFLFSWTVFIGVALGILSIIFGIIQLRRSKSKFAIAGIILSILAVLIAILLVVALFQISRPIVDVLNCKAGDVSACERFGAQISINPNTAMNCLNDNTLPECTEFNSKIQEAYGVQQ